MTLNEYISSIREKRIAVIGIGVSNTPLIRLLAENNCDVTACDIHKLEDLGDEASKLQSLGVKLKLGEEYLEDLDQDIIFRTPGLMPFDPHLVAAKERGSLITSEMEVFFDLCPCRTIAITGSDGKTTTSSIIAELLRAEGFNVHLGGNIGNPLLCSIPDFSPDDYAVLELSSFQLHSMKCKPDVAVITNISPNHLDKHDGFQDYVDAKRSILELQDENDSLILNLHDGYSDYYRSFAKAQISYFADGEPVAEGASCVNGEIYIYRCGTAVKVMNADEIRLPGEHNLQNYLAAFAAVNGIVSAETCRKIAMQFAGVEHRLEHVRVLRGVTYINDSIGTSPTRTSAGLHAMKKKPIVIAGGYDKHIEFSGLGDDLCRYAKAVFLTGDTALKIHTAITSSEYYKDNLPYVAIIEDFKSAVLAASSWAQEGDIVLFSPACAAFDHFKNFMQRGKTFKQIIMELE